jgi:hypothetical protein
MRNLAAGYIGIVLAAVCAFALMSGCDGGGGGSSSQGAVDIAGSWSGSYENEETGEHVSISATVDQDGSGVVIKTTKGNPPGQSLSGSMDGDANLTMTDAGDGEVWTSYTPTTASRIVITDFTYQPQARDTNDVPRKIIDLRR